MNVRYSNGYFKYKSLKYDTKLHNLKNSMSGGDLLKFNNIYNDQHNSMVNKKKPKCAIVTLLMMGEKYLPGILTVGHSISKFKKKDVDLICMVTNEISNLALNDIKMYFDKIIPVDYIQVDEKKMPLKNEAQKHVYSKTFTKLHALELESYQKIVLLDADMIILNNRFFDIFNYDTPSGVIVGSIFGDKIYKKYKEFLSNKGVEIKIGEKIPRQVFETTFTDGNRKYYGVETSICLLKPSVSDYKKIKTLLEKNPTKYKSDTTILNQYYKNEWHFLSPNFLGRWQDPDENSDLIVLDLYGFEGKPWDIELYDSIKNYPDVSFWYKTFISYFETSFKYVCKHPAIKQLYDFLVHNYNSK